MKVIKIKKVDSLNANRLEKFLQDVFKLKAFLNENESLVTNLVGQDRQVAKNFVESMKKALKDCATLLKNWERQVK